MNPKSSSQYPSSSPSNRPWQFDWKNPQWMAVSSKDHEDSSGMMVVGIETAQISHQEAKRILTADNDDDDDEQAIDRQDDDSRYLLSVSLLTAASREIPSSRAPPASEVMLDVLDTRFESDDTGTSCTASVVYSKRLTWPETAVASRRKQAQRRNIFSVFKPLFGIDEEDTNQQQLQPNEGDIATEDSTSTFQPNSYAGIVSATFFRRSHQSSSTVATEHNSAMDLIQLMNLGMPTTESSPSIHDDTNSTGEESQNAPKGDPSPSKTAPGDLFLICVSHSGKVFVYDPWRLLRDGDNGKAKTTHKNDDDDFSQFFFGNDLFRTLQQTWKPLSDPVATIRLSVFEHDYSNQGIHSGHGLVYGNQDQSQNDEGDDESISVLSASSASHPGGSHLGCPPPSPASTQPSDIQKIPQLSNQYSHPRHPTRRRQKPLVDPFLWNPLLETSTLHDRTHSNTPVSISVAGASYIVVTGKGVPYGSKRKKLRAKLRQLEQQRLHKAQAKTAPTMQLKRNEAPLGTGDEGGAAMSPRNMERKPREWWESSRELSEKLIQESKRRKNRTRLDSSQHSERADSVSSSVTSPSTSSHRYRHLSDSSGNAGGFVTFISSGHWSESRTLFLPFVPVSVSHIHNWRGMELIMIVGETDSVLIRLDSSGPRDLPVGDMPTTLSRRVATVDGGYSSTSPSNGGEELHVVIKKFQIISIENNAFQDASVPRRLLCGPGSNVDPPSLLELYLDVEEVDRSPKSKKTNALVLCKALSHCTESGTVALRHAPSHFAKVSFSSSSGDFNKFWGHHGQGWSLLGGQSETFLICWEGSNHTVGSYVHRLPPTLVPTRRPFSSVANLAQILPLNSSTTEMHSTSILPNLGGTVLNSFDPRKSVSAMVPLPFSTPYERQALSRNITGSFKMDVDVILQAMQDLSTPYIVSENKHDTAHCSNNIQRARMSHMQRSERLLQHCSSWTQLQETLDDRVLLERQEPILNLRFASGEGSYCLYTLRRLFVKNGAASPFQQILAWLAKGGDFFIAASIALDLLQDGETLYHLWRNASMIDEHEEESKLGGLLDGIVPIQIVHQHEPERSNTNVYVVHLADMTVGCLIKGGASMADTLRKFLNKNEFYDPARACLMLAATTARIMGESLEEKKSKINNDDLLWPVKCLLQIGIARDYLDTALLLLNVTIPDELRHRNRPAGMETLELTKNLIALIVASNPTAIDMLLDLTDDETKCGYWKSLDHETQLALALVEINFSFPVIQNPEVRAWVREELHLCLKNEVKLPTLWLQKLALACLTNSGCDLTDFEIDRASTGTKSERRSSPSEMTSTSQRPWTHRAGREESINLDEDDGLCQLQLELFETRNALMSSSNGFGIDNDLLISCLLLLRIRNDHWLPGDHEYFGNKTFAPTQTLLDAACYLAGRRPKTSVILTAAKKDDAGDEKPFLFADFDCTTAMKHCYMAGNISAGANLIGGRNGFVLHLCHILHESVGLSIRDAELFVLDNNLDLRAIEDSKMEMSSFEMGECYWKLLWLLDEHVLSVKTFGEFETVHVRGRVDPVFAARSVFRSWLALSFGDKKTASSWLSQWLRQRLEIGRFAVTHSSVTPRSTATTPPRQRDGDSLPSKACSGRHRLACAAVARSLVWPSTLEEDGDVSESLILAIVMEMDGTFLIEVCEACVGLVESVPPAALKATKILSC